LWFVVCSAELVFGGVLVWVGGVVVGVVGAGVGFAVFLEGAEVFVAVGEGALEVGFVALEAGEGVGAVILVNETEGELFGGGEGVGGLGVGGVGVVGLELVEDFGFGGGETAETPGELDDSFGEHGFGGGFGLEGVLHFLAEHGVGELVFGGEDGVAAQAVFAGVLGGDGFAVGRFWPGGFESVLTVGEKLFFGAHRSPLVAMATEYVRRGGRTDGGASPTLRRGRFPTLEAQYADGKPRSAGLDGV
jgi:hypothetical protein